MGKSFLLQLKECNQNGTCVLCDTSQIEQVIVRPNAQGIERVEVSKVYFCNKYMKRCSSKVCFEERSK